LRHLVQPIPNRPGRRRRFILIWKIQMMGQKRLNIQQNPPERLDPPGQATLQAPERELPRPSRLRVQKDGQPLDLQGIHLPCGPTPPRELARLCLTRTCPQARLHNQAGTD
jgi:hypothetical protein